MCRSVSPYLKWTHDNFHVILLRMYELICRFVLNYWSENLMVPKIEYTTCRDLISEYYGCILNQCIWHHHLYHFQQEEWAEVGGGVQHLRVTRSNMVIPVGETVKHGHTRGWNGQTWSPPWVKRSNTVIPAGETVKHGHTRGWNGQTRSYPGGNTHISGRRPHFSISSEVETT